MPIAVTEEHEAAAPTAERWLATHCPLSEPRGVAEAAGSGSTFPVWKMAAQGWLGLHSARGARGTGFPPLGRDGRAQEPGQCFFPGPLLDVARPRLRACRGPTSTRSVRCWPAWPGRHQATGVRRRLGAEPPAERRPDGTSSLLGTVRPAPGLLAARLVPVPPDVDHAEVSWVVLDRATLDPGVTSDALAPLDGIGGSRRHLEFPAEGCAIALARPFRCRRRRCTVSPSSSSPPRAPASPLVRGDGVGLRQGACPAWPAHRPVPGRQARAGRHARGPPKCVPRWLGTLPPSLARTWPNIPDGDSRRRRPSPATSHSRQRRSAPRSASRSRRDRLHLGSIDAHFYLKRAYGQPPARDRR